MRINIINHLVCPKCQGKFLLLIHKKTKERIVEGELKCKKCSRKFYIKNSIGCFTSPNKVVVTSLTTKNLTVQKTEGLKKAILNQLWPKEWKQLFSKQEFFELRREMQWMLSVVKKDKDAIHLDFATGAGMFLRKIVFQTKGEIIALDFNYSACQELVYFLKRIKKYKRVSVICADARRMPFKSGVFDSVSTWHGLDELKMEKTLGETKRVLKKEGFFTASGVHYQKDSKSFLRAKKHGIRFITKEAITRSLKKIGFCKIEHKVFFRGRWSEQGDYLPIFGDFYSTYAVRAEK